MFDHDTYEPISQYKTKKDHKDLDIIMEMFKD